MFKTTQQSVNDLKKLSEYFETVADGEELSWLRIEHDTKIKMDKRGRDLARRSLRRRPYESIRGVGIRLSSPETAITISRAKLLAVDRSVKRADKTQLELQTRHLAQMSGDNQKRMLMLASFFGAIRSVAASATAKLVSSAIER